MNAMESFTLHPFVQMAFLGVARASVLSSMGVIVVLALRWALGRRLSPQARCGLWIPVVALSLAPRLPDMGLRSQAEISVPAAVTEVPMEQPPPAVVVRGEFTPAPATATPAPEPVTHDIPWMKLAAWSWLAGVVLLCGTWLIAYARLWRRIRRKSMETPSELAALLEDCTSEMRMRRMPRLCVSSAVESPAVAGLFRPTVLAPPTLLRSLSERQVRYVLLHELGHLRRGDMWLHWLSAAVVALHWFNPLVWLAARLFRVDREAACDAAVLALPGGDHRHAYGSTLLALESFVPPSSLSRLCTGMLGGADLVKQRIMDIAHVGGRSRIAGAASILATLGAAGVLALAAAEPPTPATITRPKDSAPAATAKAGDGELYTRVYRVPPDFLTWTTDPNVDSKPGADGKKPSALEVLKALGISFHEDCSAIFVPSTAQLIVRHKEANLELIEQLVDGRLKKPLVLVHITSRLLAFDKSEAKALGLDLFAQTPPVENLLPDGATGTPAMFPGAAPGIMSIAGVFTDPQLQVVIRTIGQRMKASQAEAGTGQGAPGPAKIELFTLPSVTTRSTQKAAIEVVREHEFAVEYEKSGTDGRTLIPVRMEKKKLGFTLDVEPTIGPDGYTIDLNLRPNLLTFTRWETHQLKDGQTIRRPVFSEQNVTTAVTIWDGQTVALGGTMTIPDLKNVAVFPDEKLPAPSEKMVVLLVTAQMISPDGNPVGEAGKGPVIAAEPEIMLPAVDLKQTSLADAVSALSELSRTHDPAKRGVNVIVRHPGTEPPKVTLHLVNVSVRSALEDLARATGLVVEKDGATYVLLPGKK